MTSEEHYRRLAQMYLAAPCNAPYQPQIRIREGWAEVVTPVHEKLHHAARAVHGSVYFKSMDDASYFAVSSLVRDVFVLTVSFTVYLLRPVIEGEMRATGRVTHQSRRLFVAEAEVVDAKGRQIGRGSGTFMPSTMPLGKAMGYQDEPS